MHLRLLAIAVLLGWSTAGFSASEGREHIVPLFVPADAMATGAAGQQQGFLRIINHSNRAGMVQIYGIDDSGMTMGPAMLSIGAMETKHVNSDDVEMGSESKGLSNGLGDGQGNWRLMLSSDELDIEPLAYVRTKGDGLLISVHDIASAAGMMHRVPIFNPGANTNQRSSLRVINLGDAEANIMIAGVDDMGAAGEGSVSDTVPANGAKSVSAADIEAMGLGAGTGKWSLMVSSDQPIQVMSLMDTPSGHLANLSAAKREYRGAAGLWQVSFPSDMDGGDPVTGGLIILLPDSRLYAWLPEMGQTRIARGTYSSEGGMVSGQGVVYESGKQDLDGVTPVGGADEVSLTAEFRSGDWIRGEYTVAGEDARAFHGWAFTGFERGGSGAEIMGTWSPMGDDPDLPVTLAVGADGMFEGSLTVDAGAIGEIDCGFSAMLVPVNPAFNAYHANPAISCLGGALILGGEENPDEVEMFMSVMDAPDMPGRGDRAIVFAILPREANEIGLGAVYELTRE